MKHTPLEQLSPAAQKIMGPGPGKMMASKGMAPLAPADQVAVLYQLALDADHNIASASRDTASKLPDKLLAGTLGAPTIDARVLDFFAEHAGGKPTVFDAIVMNPSVADETVAALAAKGGPREVDIIAANEQRMLRHPEIIAAMYLNKRARMSTVDRAIELAVRNQIRVPGLAAWDEIARSLQGAPPASAAQASEADALFSYLTDAFGGEEALLTMDPTEEGPDGEPLPEVKPPTNEKWSDATMSQKIRLATLGNSTHRALAIRDTTHGIYMAAVKSPAVTDNEAAAWAGNMTLPLDVIRYIAGKREWTKLYHVRAALCRNPKTPVAEAARLMPALRDKELEKLARSKNIPSALVAQAKKLVMARRGGGGK